MNDRVEAVVRHFARCGVDVEPTIFATPVATAAAAAAQLGCEVGAIANSLVLSGGDEVVLVLASGAHRADLRHLASIFEIPKLRTASPELVFESTGQEVGGVAPCGHPTSLRTAIDTTLRRYPMLWVGGGDHHTVIPVTFDDLQRVSNAREVFVRDPPTSTTVGP